MGGALLASWARSGLLDPARSAVVDPTPSDEVLMICEQRRIDLNPIADTNEYDVCVLAVKPQMFPTVLPALNWPGIERTLFISIAAGVTIQTIGQLLAAQAPAAKIIRTMPNLPAAISKGVTLLCGDGKVWEKHREAATSLFNAAGQTVWAKDEQQLDRLMGVSGCGPAYVFLLAEALEEAAIAEGASASDARILAEATVVGAAAHLANDPRPAGALRTAVTSPGGTTAAALEVLDGAEDGLRPLAKRAVAAAFARAKQLSA